MAHVFLDANCLFDLIEGRDPSLLTKLKKHDLTISVLSIHILVYVFKYTLPDPHLPQFEDYFQLVPLSSGITLKCLQGPTPDFEDNVQLHSALESRCELFLTQDKKLLSLSKLKSLRICRPEDL